MSFVSGWSSSAAATSSTEMPSPTFSSGVQARREVDRDRAGQDQRHEQRLVQIARNHDFVARPNGRQHEGVVAGSRAIEQKEAAIGVPGVGGHGFRDSKGFAAEVRVADAATEGDVAQKRAIAECLAQLFVRADAKFVTRRRKWNDPLSLVRDDALEEWDTPVVDMRLFLPRPLHGRLCHDREHSYALISIQRRYSEEYWCSGNTSRVVIATVSSRGRSRSVGRRRPVEFAASRFNPRNTTLSALTSLRGWMTP